ncbi:redoxin domain-containing protein [Candidatus Litorirhabdus singularis]|uniref:redoxin domain-containing protein n=1 Tax=Candidatus Litorirhabdus singularis TaxID=2518993 RepID=UPI00243076A8|nr:redoxin domain-containing protein [Candidatus Litorirhabdus singularis]
MRERSNGLWHWLIAATVLLMGFSGTSVASGDKDIVGLQVDNFRLQDHTGKLHELYSANAGPAVVLMSQGNGCPIVRNAMPALKQLRDEYARFDIPFLLINANLQDNSASIAAEVDEYDYAMPVLVDGDQSVGEALRLSRTAEVYVIEVATRTVVYHGPIDDRLTYQVQKGAAKHHYLADALDAVLAGETVAVADVDAPGCLINFANRDGLSR